MAEHPIIQRAGSIRTGHVAPFWSWTMTRSPKSQSMTDLIEQYRAFAKRHGQATESGDHKEANKAAEKIAIAYRALQQLGADAQQEIVLQMTDPDPGIRLWSASHSLDFAQHEAQSELT